MTGEASTTTERHILVLDDNDRVRESVVRFLSRVPGYVVRGVGDNREAHESMRDSPVDLVLMDYNRPFGSGLDFLRETVAMRAHRRFQVIVMTGDASVGDREVELRGLGAARLVFKPVAVGALLNAIGATLSDPPRDEYRTMLFGGREDELVDYKRSLDLGSKLAVASLAKDLISMRNSPLGGYIFFGVAGDGAKFDFIGLPHEELALFDPTRVNDALRRYLGDAFSVRVQLLPQGSRTFAVIHVAPDVTGFALAQVDHEGAGLHRGRIYVRTGAARSEEVRDNAVLSEMLEARVRARARAR